MQTLKLHGTIGADIQAPQFINQLNSAAEISDQITIKIDSVGGNAFQALSIYNEIKALQDRGITITAHVEVLAASAASFIAIACNKVVMNSYAMMMIHAVGMFVQSESQQQLKDTFDQVLVDLYSKRSGKSAKQIKDLLKQDTWLLANEAKDMGLADEVISSEPIAELVEKVHQLTAINKQEKNKYELVAQLYVPKNNTNVNMLEQVKAALNLDAKANDELVVNSITSLKEANQALTAKVEKHDLLVAELNAKIEASAKVIEQFEANAKAETEKRANNLINEAVKSGKISASTRDKWYQFAVADFDGTKQLLDDLKVTVKLHQVISSVVEGEDSKNTPQIQLTPTEILMKKVGDKK